jgi:aspartyl-tRNA(Asn)/glutamyl-tRNA(Gln) amidotransferase subunit C
MGVEAETIRQLAALARLELSDAEVERARGQVSRLLEAFAQIQRVPTEGIEGTPYPLPGALRTRPDAGGPPLPQPVVLGNAPIARAGSFVVPRVVDG